jgi:hypothetical protein
LVFLPIDLNLTDYWCLSTNNNNSKKEVSNNEKIALLVLPPIGASMPTEEVSMVIMKE